MGKRTRIENLPETTNEEVEEFKLLKNVPGWIMYQKIR